MPPYDKEVMLKGTGIVFMSGIIVILVGFFFILFYLPSEMNLLLMQEKGERSKITEIFAKRVDSVLKQKFREINLIAQSPFIIGSFMQYSFRGSFREARSYINDVIGGGNRNEIFSVNLFKKNRRLILRTGKSGISFFENKRTVKMFKSGNKFVLGIVEPVYTDIATKSIIGYININYNADLIYNICDDFFIGRTGYGFIMDDKGTVIGSSDRRRIFKESVISVIKGVKGKSVLYRVMEHGGIKMVFSIKMLEDVNWFICIGQAFSEVQANYLTPLVVVTIIGVLIILIFGVLYFQIFKRISQTGLVVYDTYLKKLISILSVQSGRAPDNKSYENLMKEIESIKVIVERLTKEGFQTQRFETVRSDEKTVIDETVYYKKQETTPGAVEVEREKKPEKEDKKEIVLEEIPERRIEPASEYETKIGEYKFTNDLECLSKTMKITKDITEKIGLSQKTAALMKIAVDEACTNVITHAFKEGETGKISLNFFRDGNNLKIVLIDNGEPFNPLEQKFPDLEVYKKERRKQGLGIYVIRKTMDELDYKYDDLNRNIFTMVKKISDKDILQKEVSIDVNDRRKVKEKLKEKDLKISDTKKVKRKVLMEDALTIKEAELELTGAELQSRNIVVDDTELGREGKQIRIDGALVEEGGILKQIL